MNLGRVAGEEKTDKELEKEIKSMKRKNRITKGIMGALVALNCVSAGLQGREALQNKMEQKNVTYTSTEKAKRAFEDSIVGIDYAFILLMASKGITTIVMEGIERSKKIKEIEENNN